MWVVQMRLMATNIASDLPTTVDHLEWNLMRSARATLTINTRWDGGKHKCKEKVKPKQSELWRLPRAVQEV